MLARSVPWVALALVACTPANRTDDQRAEAAAPPVATVRSEGSADGDAATAENAMQRIAAIQRAVTLWKNAGSISEARRHAEAARNLIVGPEGPGYGDSDGDGAVSGSTAVGLLPGRKGRPALALPAPNACVHRDLLGGAWDDPARRWAILEQKIDAWRPDRNTFPTLPSHAQRVVGWATLALQARDVATARGYAAHAQIHVDVSRDALEKC